MTVMLLPIQQGKTEIVHTDDADSGSGLPVASLTTGQSLNYLPCQQLKDTLDLR